MHVLETVQLRSQEQAVSFQRALNMPRPQQYVRGQLWSTHSTLSLTPDHIFNTDVPRVVLILETFEPVAGEWPHVIVAPISLDVHMASDVDVILPPHQNALGIDCLVEVWNEVLVLEIHLSRFLGMVTPEAFQVIKNISRARALGETLAPELTAWTGPKLFGPADSRYEFQRSEIKAIAYLAQAATAAIDLLMPLSTLKSVSVSQRRLVLSLQPVRDLLSRYVPSPAVAYAASEVEDPRTLVHQSGGESSFTLELWHQKRSPYQVVAHIHVVSESVAERLCEIELRTPSGVLRSHPTPLHQGSDITIGEQAHFRLSDIEEVVITIE